MNLVFRPHGLNNLNTVARRVAKPFYLLCFSFAVESRVYSVGGRKKTEFFCPRSRQCIFLSTTGELFTSQQSCAEWVKTAWIINTWTDAPHTCCINTGRNRAKNYLKQIRLGEGLCGTLVLFGVQFWTEPCGLQYRAWSRIYLTGM